LKNTYYHQSCEGCADNKFFYLMPDLTMWKWINDIDFKEACIGKIGEDGEAIINSNNNVNWSKSALSCLKDEKCLNSKMLPDCLGGCVLYNCKNNKKNCKTFDMASLSYFY
jgi:radical SAM protein with 4Fe4S-binding SPASM domain